ncbi:MAG: cobalamin-dependent protein, partial [Desulfobacterales bacterium]
MKIILISPCKDVRFKTPKGERMPQLALHILQGLTPAEHEVHIVEEETDEVDLNAECDLVGLSCMTANAPRAYHFAAEFSKRDKTVVLGGVHPTILPEEAAQYADAVVIGEAENIWENLLEDFRVGRLQKFYRNAPPNLERYIPTKIKNKKRGLFSIFPIMTTRGCPYNCEFCSVTNIYGRKIRHAPIANVVRQIEESGWKKYIFLDDNI